MAHTPHRPADLCVRKQTQEGGLGKFDFEGFIQRVIEDGIARLVDEARHEDDIGSGQRGTGKNNPPRRESGNNKNEEGGTSYNGKAALFPIPIPTLSGLQRENWRALFRDGSRGVQNAVFDGRDEPISLARDGLDKARLLGIIAEHLPDPADCGIDTVVGIQEDAFTPDPFDDLFPRDQLSPVFNQEKQEFHGHRLEFDGNSGRAQFVGPHIQQEIASKTDRGG